MLEMNFQNFENMYQTILKKFKTFSEKSLIKNVKGIFFLFLKVYTDPSIQGVTEV